MSNELPKNPSRSALTTMLHEADDDTLRRIVAEYNLPRELADLGTTRKQRNEEQLVLARVYTQASREASQLNAQFQDEVLKALADYHTELTPGWIDEYFLSRLPNLTDACRTALLKLNQLQELTREDRNALESVYNYSPDRNGNGIDGHVDQQVALAVTNLINPRYVNGRLSGFRGFNYRLNLEESKRVAEAACARWRGESDERRIRDIYGDGDYNTGTIEEDYVSIGCQILTRREVTRVAALMGWGGFRKQHYDFDKREVVYDEEEAPTASPVRLPLETGDRVVQRNGKSALVEEYGASASVSSLRRDEDGSVSYVFRDSGTVYRDREDPRDVVETVERAAVFPVRDGDRVRLRSGNEGVAVSSGGGTPDIARINDDSGTYLGSVFRDSGKPNRVGEHNNDVVATLERAPERVNA